MVGIMIETFWKERITIGSQYEKKSVVSVITGSASGIGQAVARAYFTQGTHVVGLDKQVNRAEYLQLECDIKDENEIRRAFSVIEEKYGCINYLVNSAGVFMCQSRDLLEQVKLSDWNDVLHTNLTGTMMVTQAAIPLMKKARGDRGIVNISSDQTFYPRQKNVAYIASKMGVNGLTQSSAQELQEFGIRVNAIAPASVKTNFIRELAGSDERMKHIYQCENEKMPFGMIHPIDVAEAVLFLNSEKARKITGQILLMDSGLHL